MKISSSQFDNFLTGTERSVMEAYISHSYQAVSQLALSRTFLNEVSDSLRLKAQNVSWIAFAPFPYENCIWFVNNLAIEDSGNTSVEFAPSQRLAAEINLLREKLEKKDLAVSSHLELSQNVINEWGTEGDEGRVYTYLVRFDLDIELPKAEGLLVVALTSDVSTGQSREARLMVYDQIEPALQCIRDRIRSATLSEGNSLRILTSIDDEAQVDLIKARRSEGLYQFFDTFKRVESIDATLINTTYSQDAPNLVELNNYRQSLELEVGTDEIRREFERFILDNVKRHKDFKRPIIEEAKIHDHGGTLTTPLGLWTGWSAYTSSIFNKGCAVMSICFNVMQFQRELARFFKVVSQGGNKSGYKVVKLVIFTPNDQLPLLKECSNIWKGLIDVSVTNLPDGT